MDGRRRSATIAATRERPLPALRFDAREFCHLLVASLIGLNIGDVITTRAVMARGGAESNPLMRAVVDSTLHTSLLKGLLLAVVFVLVMRTRVHSRAALTLCVVTIWYTVVVTWNLALLARV